MKNTRKRALTARDVWLRSRVIDCIHALNDSVTKDDWVEFKNKAIDFSEELAYAVTEWDKYYLKEVDVYEIKDDKF